MGASILTGDSISGVPVQSDDMKIINFCLNRANHYTKITGKYINADLLVEHFVDKTRRCGHFIDSFLKNFNREQIDAF